MRTTVRLPEELLRRAKQYASQHRTTFTALVAEGLSLRLAHAVKAKPKLGPMPTYRGSGLRPGMDLIKTSWLLDLDRMEKRRGPP